MEEGLPSAIKEAPGAAVITYKKVKGGRQVRQPENDSAFKKDDPL